MRLLTKGRAKEELVHMLAFNFSEAVLNERLFVSCWRFEVSAYLLT